MEPRKAVAAALSAALVATSPGLGGYEAAAQTVRAVSGARGPQNAYRGRLRVPGSQGPGNFSRLSPAAPLAGFLNPSLSPSPSPAGSSIGDSPLLEGGAPSFSAVETIPVGQRERAPSAPKIGDTTLAASPMTAPLAVSPMSNSEVGDGGGTAQAAFPQAPARTFWNAVASVFTGAARKPSPESSQKVFDGAAQRPAFEFASAVPLLALPSGLTPAAPGAQSPSSALKIPAPKGPVPAGKPRSALLRYGVPAAIALGVAAIFHAALLPVAMISGALVGSILIHETAHLWALRIYGDKTPRAAGRDSLNPLRNISMTGTILVPALSLAVSTALTGFPILLGWAKPVPVDFNNLKDPKKDAAKVALFGPAANLALAAVAGLAWLALPAAAAGGAAALVLSSLFKMNLALTVFNMIPIPSLDGGKVLIGLLPKKLYERWVYNPNIPGGYQTTFQRIYEGPSNILSRFHVHSLEKVNGLTRLVSLAALGAFYAVFFGALHVPLLFLALPCSYDYWCIREKVRSEAAVKDLMSIMSQWGSVIAQAAEDLGAKSEVSAFEAEHALKNALETAIDELMDKAEFRALSDEDKLKELMRVYPDAAAKFLKGKKTADANGKEVWTGAMTEDSEEVIKAVLADARNKPYFERVEQWVKDHEVFKKWGSPHAKKKLKDTLEEADSRRANGAGGLGGETPPSAPGSDDGGLSAAPESRLKARKGRAGDNPGVLWVHFARGTTSDEALAAVDRSLEGIPNSKSRRAAPGASRKGVVHVRIQITDPAQAAEAARLLLAERAVKGIAAHSDVVAAYKAASTPAVEVGDAASAAVMGDTAKVVSPTHGTEEPVGDSNQTEPPFDAPAPGEVGGDPRGTFSPEPVAETSPVAEVPAAPAAPAWDEARSILVKFTPGTAQETMETQVKAWGLRLVEAEYRGGDGLALLEVPEGTDPDFIVRSLADEIAPGGNYFAVTHLKERPSAAPKVGDTVEVMGDTTKVVSPAQTAPEPAPAPSPRPERRDPLAAWMNFLNTRVLADGKSTLTPDQVKGLARYLKPVDAAGKNPTVARNPELKKILPIITSPRKMRNSVILVGEAGVGKTAVAEGLAELIEEAQYAEDLAGRDGIGGGAGDHLGPAATAIPGTEHYLQLRRLKGRWLVELNIDLLLSADEPVKEFNALIALLPLLSGKADDRGNEVIVFIDEIHKLFMDPAGKKIANALKSPLRDGKLSVLAATTEKEFKTYIAADDAFNRRMEMVTIAEPSVEAVIAMLRASKAYLEKLHGAEISDEALVAAARLYHQFDKKDHNPSKAFNGVHDSSELARPENLRGALALDIRETWRQLVLAAEEARRVMAEKGIASALALPVEAYNAIAALAGQAVDLYARLGEVPDGKGQVGVDVIKKSLAEKTGIASGQLSLGAEDSSRYVNMEAEIGRKVINQDRALLALANAIRRNKAGLSNPTRPMAKFLMAGPTGVGKTYIAKELARFLFNDPAAMVRFDMSEFMEEHTYMRLVGAPPSYVGYGEGGQLTEAVRKKPYSVILFDEIEKAHPKVWNIFLQILDDGRLTDSEGRTIDFKNTVILMSSNSGMEVVDGEKYAGLLARAKTPEEKAGVEAAWDAEIALAVAEGIKARFRPEFINRLDEDPTSKSKWIIFNRLKAEHMEAIARLQMRDFQDLLRERHDSELRYSDGVIEHLKREGFSPLYGARPMTGAIEKHIIDPLARWILEQSASGKKDIQGSLIQVDVRDGKIVFGYEPRPAVVPERRSLEGAAQSLARDIMVLVEGWAGGTAEPPTEAKLDEILKALLSPPVSVRGDNASSLVMGDTTKVVSPSQARRFYHPGTSLELTAAKTAAAAHNNAGQADDNIRYEIKKIKHSITEAQWPEGVLDLVAPPLTAVGVGWLKHFVRHAKEAATQAGTAEPITMSSQVDADYIRLKIHGPHEQSPEEAARLAKHFTGEPPKSFGDAQAQADDRNLSSAMVWDHHLWDLYRRLASVPGARMGVATGSMADGGKGTDYWLEIPKFGEAPGPQAGPAPTPHRAKWNARTRELLLKMVRQDGMQDYEKDGPAVKVAAATGFALLSGPEEAKTVRAWIRDGGWTSAGAFGSRVKEFWPMSLTAARVLERHGVLADIPTVETLARRVSSFEHIHVPLKGALTAALTALYVRAGPEEARKALEREKAESNKEIAAAARMALGRTGTLEDREAVKESPEALVALLGRLAPEDLSEMIEDFWPPKVKADGSYESSAWTSHPTERRIAVLDHVGRNSRRVKKELPALLTMMSGKLGDDRPVKYAAAEAFAEIAVRENMLGGLQRNLEKYLEADSMTSYNNTDGWGLLLGMIYLLQRGGGPENLMALEEIMKKEPGNIQSVHEQAYFNTPLAWAKTVVRNGRFQEYASPKHGPDGAELPSKIQEMLASKNPMFAAAALHAVVLAQLEAAAEASLGDTTSVASPVTDLPDMTPPPASPTPSYPAPGYGGYRGRHSRFDDPFYPGGHMHW